MLNTTSPQAGLIKSIYTNMNKILTFEGGQPFTIEDLEFLQSSIIDAMSTIVASLVGNMNCILIPMKDDNSSAAPQAVYIDGNIYVLDKPVSGGSNKHYLCINPKESEQRTFRDSVVRNVYLVDDAYMSETPSAISMDMRTAYTLNDIIVHGKGLWESISPEFDENTSGDVLFPDYNKTIRPKSSVLINITKTSDNQTNRLWHTQYREPEEYRGVVVSDSTAYVLVASKTIGLVYNLDGTPYNGPITISNLELK